MSCVASSSYVTFVQGKQGSVPAGKGSARDTSITKKPVWTKEDTMARKIQTFYKGYRSTITIIITHINLAVHVNKNAFLLVVFPLATCDFFLSLDVEGCCLNFEGKSKITMT